MKTTFTPSRPSRGLLAAATIAGILALGSVSAQSYTGPRTEASAAQSEPRAQRSYNGPRGDKHADTRADKRTDKRTDKRGYAGPSSLTVTTVKELLDNGRDDQRALLRGRIVSWEGGKHYTFADETGQIRLELSRKYFPHDRDIDDKTTVEIYGKLEKDRRGVEFDVKQPIRIP